MESAARVVEVESGLPVVEVAELVKELWLFIGEFSPGPAPAGFQAELSIVEGGEK